jgi:hypothetical protein
MLRLFGEPISGQEAANLSVALLSVGDKASVSAARAIEAGMPAIASIRLDETERRAIRRLLESPPPSLAALRGRLN